MEYRRFIAYFYEYINGKKQKNAGFAKVELRNGIWRILLRLTTGLWPDPPIRVYGFVREEGFLLGFLLGTIHPVQEIVEEWAFRADAPIGKDRYRLEDFAGIWVESADGRRFVTVWDDEEIDTEKFVLELPGAEKEHAESGASEEAGEGNPEAEKQGAGGLWLEEPGAGNPETEKQGTGNPGSGKQGAGGLWPEEAGAGSPEAEKQEAGSLWPEEAGAGNPVPGKQGTGSLWPEKPDGESPEVQPLREISGTEAACPETAEEPQPETTVRCGTMEELLRKRSHFQPFADAEIADCVMILPCDIVRLQQENWQVGRSSFLQHAFYQHRHLLLARAGSGSYILGVPGVRNPQETYMAQMFGFGDFKMTGRQNSGQPFGYWCRRLEQCEP